LRLNCSLNSIQTARRLKTRASMTRGRKLGLRLISLSALQGGVAQVVFHSLAMDFSSTL
jgi:hypothetical protein